MVPFVRCPSLFFGFCVSLLLSLTGCGPITATTSIADATVAIQAAEGVEAPKYSPYEYHSAVLFLRKAREEEGYSDFQAAVDLATKARVYAEKAKDNAMTNPNRGLQQQPGGAVVPTSSPADGLPTGSKL